MSEEPELSRDESLTVQRLRQTLHRLQHQLQAWQGRVRAQVSAADMPDLSADDPITAQHLLQAVYEVRTEIAALYMRMDEMQQQLIAVQSDMDDLRQQMGIRSATPCAARCCPAAATACRLCAADHGRVWPAALAGERRQYS
ncbi:MAG: hypothetical protein HC893_12185 [Chloroflexaceae bacterium]|nr:hypothetical protein [Chloroflexaceae bacterium]